MFFKIDKLKVQSISALQQKNATTVFMSDQFNVSLLNKSIYFYKKKSTDPKFLNGNKCLKILETT